MSPEKATNVKNQRLPAVGARQSLLNLRLDILGLLMDSQRFRQPRRAISCADSIMSGGLSPLCLYAS
jgi:hypothetical protein